MPLFPGQTLSSYKILAPLGAGGMGEVYRARDNSLGRDVAIKVLPDLLARDTERVLRFRREAKLLASLSHPNIGAIHGFDSVEEICEAGTASTTHFLVLEYIEGQSLGQRLEKGPLAVEEALEVCVQVAEALEAAHDKGIIHRDLKPDNVQLKPDGTVKVLDFGLARAISEDPTPVQQEDTTAITTHFLQPGAVMGSVPYLSPEQVRSKPVDKRSDIWAFGCLLYECMTNRKMFDGETPSDTIAKILESEADWSRLPSRTPRSIRHLLRRCLEKNPKRRLRDIGDARIEIEEAIEHPRRIFRVSKARRPSALGSRFTVGLGSAVAGALAFWLVSGPADPGPTVVDHKRLTYESEFQNEWATWGTAGQFAFATNHDGNFEIYVGSETEEAVNVTRSPADDYQPDLSPDGSRIVFVSTRGDSNSNRIRVWGTTGFDFRTFGGDVWIAQRMGGGTPSLLARNGNSPIWHPDGFEIAYVGGGEDHRAILRVTPERVNLEPVLSGEDSTWEIVRIQYSPTGDYITFETIDQGIYAVPTSGGEPWLLAQGTSHAWGPDRSDQRLYYLDRQSQGGTLLKMLTVDLASQESSAEPRTVDHLTGVFRDLAVDPTGEFLIASELEEALNLTSLYFDEEGEPPDEWQLNAGQVMDRYPSFSADSSKIVFSSNRRGRQEIWILHVVTGDFERVEILGDENLQPILPFFRDEDRLIVTLIEPDGSRSLQQVEIETGSMEEILSAKPGLLGGPVHNGVVLYSYKVGDYLQLHRMDLQTRKEVPLTQETWDTYSGLWSNDGSMILYFSNQSGSIQVWQMTSSGRNPEPLTDESMGRIRHAFYSPDRNWLYIQPDHKNIVRMSLVDRETVEPVTTYLGDDLFLEEPMLSPDGRTLVYGKSNGGSSLWMFRLENQ